MLLNSFSLFMAVVNKVFQFFLCIVFWSNCCQSLFHYFICIDDCEILKFLFLSFICWVCWKSIPYLWRLGNTNHLWSTEYIIKIFMPVGHGSSIGCTSAWYTDGCRFDPHAWQNILLWWLGHEKISTAILSLQPIQEGHLSVTGERVCTKY